MTGNPLSAREKQYIRAHADDMSRGHIAQQLGILFPEDNQGYRSWRSVRSFLQREQQKVQDTLSISIPVDIIIRSGIPKEEIEQIARKAIIEELQR